MTRTVDMQTQKTWVGKLTLVDLAGSERISKSEVTGVALTEAKVSATMHTARRALCSLPPCSPALTCHAVCSLSLSLSAYQQITVCFGRCGVSSGARRAPRAVPEQQAYKPAAGLSWWQQQDAHVCQRWSGRKQLLRDQVQPRVCTTGKECQARQGREERRGRD